MTYESAPLRFPRLVALFMSFAFGAIGGSVGLNALIKSNQEHTKVNKAGAALGATITIDDKDVFDSGIVLTTICTLIGVLSFNYFFLTLIPRSRGPPLGTRTLPFQYISLAFCALWLFATQIAFTDFFANRSAGISATIGGIQVPESVIQATQTQLGLTSVYKDIHYLRLLAILPWFAILFATISAVVLFVASRRRVVPAAASTAGGSTERREDEVEEVREREKGGDEINEREKVDDEKGRV